MSHPPDHATMLKPVPHRPLASTPVAHTPHGLSEPSRNARMATRPQLGQSTPDVRVTALAILETVISDPQQTNIVLHNIEPTSFPLEPSEGMNATPPRKVYRSWPWHPWPLPAHGLQWLIEGCCNICFLLIFWAAWSWGIALLYIGCSGGAPRTLLRRFLEARSCGFHSWPFLKIISSRSSVVLTHDNSVHWLECWCPVMGPYVPPGQSPPFEVVDEYHHGAWIIITAALGLVVSLVCFLIRLYVRLMLIPPFARDDFVLLGATVCLRT